MFAIHLCRGNQGGRWLVEGSYDRIVEPVLQRIHAQRLMLEYDDPRTGSFEPLRGVPDDKLVALGLVTTKSPRAETPAELESSNRRGCPSLPAGATRHQSAVRVCFIHRRQSALDRAAKRKAPHRRRDRPQRLGVNFPVKFAIDSQRVPSSVPYSGLGNDHPHRDP